MTNRFHSSALICQTRQRNISSQPLHLSTWDWDPDLTRSALSGTGLDKPQPGCAAQGLVVLAEKSIPKELADGKTEDQGNQTGTTVHYCRLDTRHSEILTFFSPLMSWYPEQLPQCHGRPSSGFDLIFEKEMVDLCW